MSKPSACSSRRVPITFLIAAALTVLLACAGFAADAATQPVCPPVVKPVCPTGSGPDNNWHYSLTPYFWLTSISGSVAAQGKTADVDVGVTKIIEHLNWLTEAHIEARKGDFGFYVDPTYVKLSIGASSNGNPASVAFREWLIDFAATYRVHSTTSPDGYVQSFDVLVGGRYWNLSTDVNITGGGRGSGSRQWVDPIVGARYTTDLDRRWTFLFQGDIGGFGAGSEFTWSAAPLFFYHIAPNRSIVLGYRALCVNYSTGSAGDLYEQDVTYHGPILGYEFAF